MYVVLDNGRPATDREFGWAELGWNNNKFATSEEAYQYAREWLGWYESCLNDVPTDKPCKVYYTKLDYIEIKKVT